MIDDDTKDRMWKNTLERMGKTDPKVVDGVIKLALLSSDVGVPLVEFLNKLIFVDRKFSIKTISALISGVLVTSDLSLDESIQVIDLMREEVKKFDKKINTEWAR